jgi:DNA-directed RNA polymerase subunit RPC12/RpoP
MEFSEKIKSEVKTKAHYRCCICENVLPLHIHHIIPESDDGPNTFDNAIALCPSCHSIYGSNPDQRKWIRERRNFWYDHCAKESVIMEKVEEMHNIVIDLSVSFDSKYNGLVSLMSGLAIQNTQILSKVGSASPSERLNLMSNFAAASGTMTIVTNAVTQLSKGIYHYCPNCKSAIAINSDQNPIVCPNCNKRIKL